MNKKKIVWCHGDKGGCGKSFTASVVADYFSGAGASVLVAECDSSIPDVAARFDGRIDTAIIPMSRSDEVIDSFGRFFEALEKIDHDVVVVNLPANSGEAIDPLAEDIIGPALAVLGREVIVLYTLSESPESVALASNSMDNGLCSIADRKVAVLNGYCGNVEHFAWTASDARRQWLASGGTEEFLPRLHDRVKPLVTGPFSDYLGMPPRDPSLTSFNRILLTKWLSEAHQIGVDIARQEDGMHGSAEVSA